MSEASPIAVVALARKHGSQAIDAACMTDLTGSSIPEFFQ